MQFAKTLSFSEFLQKEDCITRTMFDNIAMRFMSDWGLPNAKANNYHIKMIEGMQSYHFLLAISAKRNLARSVAIGVFENLDMSLSVLCWRRGWAAPDVLPRIHSNSERRAFRTIDSRTRVLLRQKSKFDNQLYSFGITRLQQDWCQLTSAAGNSDRVREFLDAEHRKHFFSATPQVYAVDVSADRAWPGTGWGLRERNEHGQVWRWIGSSARSTFLANLVPGTDYLLTLVIYTAADVDTLDSLKADIHGELLQFAGKGQHDGYTLRYWLIGKGIVVQYAGQLEIALSVGANANGNCIALSRIVCHPW